MLAGSLGARKNQLAASNLNFFQIKGLISSLNPLYARLWSVNDTPIPFFALVSLLTAQVSVLPGRSLIRSFFTMPPTQATLRYVKDPQTSLSKFYGSPKKTHAPAKQSKLSFKPKTLEKKKEIRATSPKTLNKGPILEKEDLIDHSETSELEAKKRTRSPLSGYTVNAVPEDTSEDEDEPVLKRRRMVKIEGDILDDAASTKSISKDYPRRIQDEERPKKSSILVVLPKQNSSTIVKQEIEKDTGAVSPSNISRGKINKTTKLSKLASERRSSVESAQNVKDDTSTVDSQKNNQMILGAKTTDPYPDWSPGEKTPYAALCTTFSLIEMTTKRLKIVSHCTLFLRQVLRLTPNDLLPTVLLMVNKLAADYAGIELGIGESLIMKAIGESTGRSLAVIKEDQKEIGDLALVAVKSRSRQPTMFAPKPLTIHGVHKALTEIATVTGQGAQTRKVDLIKKILSSADANNIGSKVDITENKGGPSEAKFIVRFLEGKLRLGLAEKTVLVSLAQAVVYHEVESNRKGTKIKEPSPEQLTMGESILKAVYSELPSYEIIIPTITEHGIYQLREKCKLQPGVPLKPMLAKPTKSVTEVLDRFENHMFTCEYKYDGERAQIHYVAKDSPVSYSGPASTTLKAVNGGLAAIFSRNSEDLSKKYPDILDKLHTWVQAETKSFVLDCESVAWDVIEKRVLPFQQLMTRKKKDVKIEDVKVKVCVFAFDLLFLNGQPVVKKSLRKRRELLRSSFIPVNGEFSFAIGIDGQELEEIHSFLDESIKASCEGLMVKMLDGPESSYEPSKRSQNWLKIKKDYLAGIGDSLDLVVLGAYYGRGKRTSVYGAFLLACYNPISEGYETICNIGTGFSDSVLEELHQQLSPIVIDRPKPFYHHASSGSHQPDVWFESKYVWEVKAADLTFSPRYKAGFREESGQEKGISLRFPRFIRIRDDKRPEMASTSRQVMEMYRKQENVMKSHTPAVDDDFEY